LRLIYNLFSGPQQTPLLSYLDSSHSTCELDYTFSDKDGVPLTFPTTYFDMDLTDGPVLKVPDTSIVAMVGDHMIKVKR
jgi:hypothetical protein